MLSSKSVPGVLEAIGSRSRNSDFSTCCERGDPFLRVEAARVHPVHGALEGATLIFAEPREG